MPEVECISIHGNTTRVPREKLRLRASVYGIIVYDGRLLLVRSRTSGKYGVPGGGIEIGERIEDALTREVSEETGIEIEVERFTHFREEFFYYDPNDTAYHSYLFYYLCRPVTLRLACDEEVDDDEVEKPGWIEIEKLRAEDIQTDGEAILDLVRQR